MTETIKLGKLLNYKAGKKIFSEGEQGKHMYFILAGSVQIYKGDTLLRELEAGETFGELGILATNLRTATVYAQTDVTLEVFDRSVLTRHIEASASVEEKRAANNLINYIAKLDHMAVEITKIKSELPDKETIDVYEEKLNHYLEKNTEIGKIFKNILKFKSFIKEDIKKKVDEL